MSVSWRNHDSQSFASQSAEGFRVLPPPATLISLTAVQTAAPEVAQLQSKLADCQRHGAQLEQQLRQSREELSVAASKLVRLLRSRRGRLLQHSRGCRVPSELALSLYGDNLGRERHPALLSQVEAESKAAQLQGKVSELEAAAAAAAAARAPESKEPAAAAPQTETDLPAAQQPSPQETAEQEASKEPCDAGYQAAVEEQDAEMQVREGWGRALLAGCKSLLPLPGLQA